ncbi:hypothetical protein KR032_001881, partial [Drosophila birchii]
CKMFQRSLLSLQIVILLKIVSLSIGIQYEFDFEDDQIYSKCPDSPNGTLSMFEWLDFSDFTFELSEEGIFASGNLTTMWEVEPTDRIEARINVLHWERGFWQPTILNVYIFDFCKVMYDKNQLWYNLMIEHVINVEEVKEKCIKYKGVSGRQFKGLYKRFVKILNFQTTLVYEPYLVKVRFGMGMVIPPGRHRIIVNAVAIDLNNVTRPNGICYELRGQFYKI